MGAGKSTLIHYLKNDPGPQQQREETPVNYHVKSHYTPHIKTPVEENDLALGYSFIDVKDEEHEGKSFPPLLHCSLTSESSRRSIGMLSTRTFFP